MNVSVVEFLNREEIAVLKGHLTLTLVDLCVSLSLSTKLFVLNLDSHSCNRIADTDHDKFISDYFHFKLHYSSKVLGHLEMLLFLKERIILK